MNELIQQQVMALYGKEIDPADQVALLQVLVAIACANEVRNRREYAKCQEALDLQIKIGRRMDQQHDDGESWKEESEP